MNKSDLHFTLALQCVPQIGDIKAKKLIHHCGSAEMVFRESASVLLKIPGIGKNIVKEISGSVYLKKAENEMKFIENNDFTCHYFLDDGYPSNLKHCVDGPILLFQRGNINLNNQRMLSVVGTRNITTSGRSFCEMLIDHLSVYNPVVVSGLAYGTDITAQVAAIEHNLQTIGCLAHGLNQIYPKRHSKYAGKIEAFGGFFTDFWSTDDFSRNNFLKRNRIIAGLSEATVVIESAERGGSLVTADLANGYDREVFAVPGRVGDKFSVGCNNLIKSQRAHLLSEPADIPYLLNWELESVVKPIQKQLFNELSPEEKTLISFLENNGKEDLDYIALKCEMPTFKVASLLLQMELKGLVRPLPGKSFELA